MRLKTKRVYDEYAKSDGTRVLVDRVWPRGVSKEAAQLDDWVKAVAPSSGLRKWFGHDPDKWSEFKRRYFKELDEAPDAVKHLREVLGGGTATLIFAAKDEEHNNAVALKAYLEDRG